VCYNIRTAPSKVFRRRNISIYIKPFMKVKYTDFIIIVARDSWGFNETTAPVIVKTIESQKPDYYQYYNPTAFFVYFILNRKNVKKSKKLIEDMIHIVKTYIKYFEEFEIGYHEGRMICSKDIFGKIISEPLGGAGNKVYNNIIFKL